MTILSDYRHFLRRRSVAGLERFFARPSTPSRPGRAVINGREYIDFSGNDYLGLSRHRHLARQSARAARKWGSASRGSRLLAGDLQIMNDLEKRIATGVGKDGALLFSSGFQANISVIAALCDPGSDDPMAIGSSATSVFSDRLNHASIHAGCRLAGIRQHRFRHLDYAHLDALLSRYGKEAGRRLIISETVFSMDGDHADLDALSALAKRHKAMLYLDDAHGFGVFGRHGFGRAAHRPADVIVGTFGKAAASIGAYVATGAVLRHYLINRCGATIYSTAPAPPTLGVVAAALDIFATQPHLRRRVRNNAAFLRRRLGIKGPCNSPIVPILTGDISTAQQMAIDLEKKGFLVPAIRYPTVPKGTERLRISLSAAHRQSDLERLIDALSPLWQASRA